MAQLIQSDRGETVTETGIIRKGGHASSNELTTIDQFPAVPAGPAQGALAPDPTPSTTSTVQE
jgi:hypothetical protein